VKSLGQANCENGWSSEHAGLISESAWARNTIKCSSHREACQYEERNNERGLGLGLVEVKGVSNGLLIDNRALFCLLIGVVT